MRIIPFLTLGIATALSAQTTEVGEGNWKNVPYLKGNYILYPNRDNGDAIDGVVASGKCDVIGNRRQIDMKVPFIAQIAAGRDVQRIVVRRIGCPEVERIVAGVVLNAARNGQLRSGTRRETAWFRGEVEYNLQ